MRGSCHDRLPMKRLVNLGPAPCQIEEIPTAGEPRTYGLRRVLQTRRKAVSLLSAPLLVAYRLDPRTAEPARVDVIRIT
jgi:hypothetical protein